MRKRWNLTEVLESFDGSQFEVVSASNRNVVLRASDGRRLTVPVWKLEAGMLKQVKSGRQRLYAPSDIIVDREFWALDYSLAVDVQSKSKRKNRYLCRIYSDVGSGSVSYKHLTPRKICALLNTEVDHIVEGDLRPGVEFKNGIRIERRHGNFVRFSIPYGCHFVSDVETFLEVINAK